MRIAAGKTNKKQLIAIVVGLSLLTSVGTYTKQAHAVEAITVNPIGGTIGTSISISGSGFAASATGDVWFDSNNNSVLDSGEPSTSVTASPTGTFTASLTVPAVADASYNIRADVPSGGAVEASASFIVGTFIDINLATFNITERPNAFPFGIDCGVPLDPNNPSVGDQKVYLTIFGQGLVARIDKTTKAVEDVFDDPDDALVPNQNFYSIARDPNAMTDTLYINERDNGKLWRFIPANLPDMNTAWARIPLIEQVSDPVGSPGYVEYPDPNAPGVFPDTQEDIYKVRPNVVKLHTKGPGGIHDHPGEDHTHTTLTTGEGTVVFANGFIWVGLTYSQVWHAVERNDGLPILSFRGLAKVNPTTLQVTRISIAGALGVTGLAVDSADPNILWITDFSSNKVFKFDTSTQSVVATIDLAASNSLATKPRGIATDNNNVYVALNKPSSAGGNSQIARISKSTLTVDLIINTGAPVTADGTFSVFVAGDNNDVLIWTDQSQHVGTIDLAQSPPQAEPFFTTAYSVSNHFGCIPKDGEFWFAGKGSARVGILPNSKFSVGGRARPTGGGGGHMAYEIADSKDPSIEGYYWKPNDPSAGNDVTVYVETRDDVGVQRVTLWYQSPIDDYKEEHATVMEGLNGGSTWHTGSVVGSFVGEPSIKVWFVAEDYAGNSAQSDTITVNVGPASSAPEAKSTVTSLPAHVLEAIKLKAKPDQPVEKLEVISMNDGKEVKTYPDKIIIKNVGSRTVDNIRLILSPEISKSFRLSDTSIKSIEPNGNVTVTLELNGSPNRDMVGGLVGYKGEVIVMAEHHSPMTLPVNIAISGASYELSSYMDAVAMMAEQRYNKISLLNSILSKQAKTQYNYEVTTSNEDNIITSPSDELIIRNLSDKELKNVRIYLSNAGNAFLLDQKVIQYLEPNGQVSIKLIPRIDTAKYSPKDIKGELLIVPSNDKPIQIPINIVREERKDSADEFEVSTISDKMITTAVDKITIKNVAGRTMDSVKIELSGNLDRIFSLSESSFQHIEPGEEVIVELKYNAGDLKTFMQNYEGELTIVSEHHNMRSIPISIEWKEISSEHFTVYARSGDEQTAEQLVKMLEENYQKLTSRFGEMKTKTVIYMTASMDEMKLVNPSGHPYYSYADDTIFMCSCDDPNYNAVKQFIYRLIINNYVSYYNMQKIIFDQENWLLDGITSYVAGKIVDNEIPKKYLDAFANNSVSFQWYGYGSDEQYGATYTFMELLHSKYGDYVIDRTLGYLGSGMISNHRCSTLEDCAVLRAVYDANGLDMDNKRHNLNFEAIVKEWKGYVKDHSINSEEPSEVKYIALGTYTPNWKGMATYHIE